MTTKNALDVLTRDGRVLHRFEAKTPYGLSRASWSPNGRRLAFASRHPRGAGGDSRLVTADVDGGHRRELTGRVESAPHWSPDGRTIYYARARGSGSAADPDDIYAIPSAGGSLRRVVHGITTLKSLSPNGRWLLFTRSKPDGFFELWIARSDGSKERMLDAEVTDGRGYGWAGGGRGVYTLRYDDGSRLRLAVISTSGKRRELSAKVASTEFAWSPDGRRIAWGVSGAKVVSSRPDGTDRRVLARFTAKSYFAEISDLVWSPDNRTLAVEAHRHEGD